jgi:hypothetical protein
MDENGIKYRDKELSGMIQTLVLSHLCQKFDEG